MKDKHAPEKSTSFEEFVASVIKDKPANIDQFFENYVKTLFEARCSLRDYCKSLQLLAENNNLDEAAETIKVLFVNSVNTKKEQDRLHRRLFEVCQQFAISKRK